MLINYRLRCIVYVKYTCIIIAYLFIVCVVLSPCYCVHFYPVLTELVLAPINTVVVSGDVMRMSCLTSNNSKVGNWDIFTTNLEPFTIYFPHKFHSLFKHFGVDVDGNGPGVLYTNSTTLGDAGIYKCFSTIDGKEKEHSAQLTVLGKSFS